MKQTRQPAHAVKQSIYLDVYGVTPQNLKKSAKAQIFLLEHADEV
jgi:hypothetical protein